MVILQAHYTQGLRQHHWAWICLDFSILLFFVLASPTKALFLLQPTNSRLVFSKVQIHQTRNAPFLVMPQKVEFHLPDLGHMPIPGTWGGSGRMRPTQATWTDYGHGVVCQGKYIPQRRKGFLAGKSIAITAEMLFPNLLLNN